MTKGDFAKKKAATALRFNPRLWCGINPQRCVLAAALATGGAEAQRAFAAMMEMGKIDIAKIEKARRG